MNKIKPVNDVPEKKPTQPLPTPQAEPKSATPEATKPHTTTGTLPVDLTPSVAQNSNPAPVLTSAVPQ
jgi:hypothetical protein